MNLRIRDSDLLPCQCGHDAAFHCKQFTNGDQPGEIVFNTYLHCEWNDFHVGYYSKDYKKELCDCKQFKRDNLIYLEQLSAKR